MLHLIDRKYLQVYEFLDRTKNSFFLTNVYTPSHEHVTLFNTLNKNEPGQVLMKHDSLDDAIIAAGGATKFLQSIVDANSSERELLIYTSYNDYLKLTCLWFKAVLPNFTLDAFKDLVTRDIAKTNYYGYRYFNQRSSSIRKLYNEEFSVTPQSIEETIINELSQRVDSLEEIWNNTEKVSLTVDPVRLSIENQMARYAIDGENWSGASAYKSLFVDFVLNEVITDFIEELKTVFIENLFNLKKIADFAGFDPLTDDLKTWMGNSHPYRFLTDINFYPNNLEYIKENYDLTQLSEIYYSNTVQPYHLDLCFSTDYETQFNHEFNDKFGLRHFGTEHKAMRTSNSYMILFINKLSKENSPRLKEFAV